MASIEVKVNLSHKDRSHYFTMTVDADLSEDEIRELAEEHDETIWFIEDVAQSSWGDEFDTDEYQDHFDTIKDQIDLHIEQ